MEPTMSQILTLERLAKRYPGVVALDGVDLSLSRGEVRALLGKNGAGKSTLIKILSGAVHPDSGTIRINGAPVHIHSPHDAFAQGIATVYQELSLVPGLNVAENITLGRWPRQKRFGISMIDRQQILRLAATALEQLEIQLDLHESVEHLSIAQQQLVEIAKAISFDPQVLVLDEPTSALTGHEVLILHKVVRRLAERGRGILYVTHRMHEIPQVADSVTVLRDGHHIGTIPVHEASPGRIATMMIGSNWQRTEWGSRSQPGDVRLAVRNLSRKGVLENISFELRAGELVGIAGLLGSGRTELVRAIFGRDPIDSGEIIVNNTPVSHPTPRRMRQRGIGLIPEHRKQQGLVLGASVQDNLTMAALGRASRGGILQPGRERELTEEMIKALAIKTANAQVATGTLSGGNQQKVVIGKWLNTLPGVLLLDEPTRGIDIHAKEQIFQLMRTLAAQGLAILVISSEIEEVLDIADRILIMRHGRLVGEVLPNEINLEQLMTMVMEESYAQKL
jgi:ribose transport system ATP-binding protein